MALPPGALQSLSSAIRFNQKSLDNVPLLASALQSPSPSVRLLLELYFFNQGLNNVTLASALQSLSVCFNQSLDNEALTYKMFIMSLENVSLPSSGNLLFNQSLENVSLHSGLPQLGADRARRAWKIASHATGSSGAISSTGAQARRRLLRRLAIGSRW